MLADGLAAATGWPIAAKTVVSSAGSTSASEADRRQHGRGDEDDHERHAPSHALLVSNRGRLDASSQSVNRNGLPSTAQVTIAIVPR